MSGVTDFWNAMHIVNILGKSLPFEVKAEGNKQLFSPSQAARNVPDGHTSDTYFIEIPANGSIVIGAGIFRNDDFDQETRVTFGSLGTLSFNQTEKVSGSDISQAVSWSGPQNVLVPTGVRWNFNKSTEPVLTITFS
jgi:hypothetical protein